MILTFQASVSCFPALGDTKTYSDASGNECFNRGLFGQRNAGQDAPLVPL